MRTQTYMHRLLLTLLLLTTGFLVSEVDAQACSCGRASPAMLVRGAEQVFVARAGKVTPNANGSDMHFEVLYSMRGVASKSFIWKRGKGKAPCMPSYKKGDISVLFVSQGQLSVCAGNYGMAGQAVALPSYLRSSRSKISKLKEPEMQVLLKHALDGYLHKRPIWVEYSPLGGKSIQIDSTEIRIRSRWKKKVPKRDAIKFFEALRSGPILYLSGRYRGEGIRFRVILFATSTGYELMHKEVVEE